MEQEGLTYRPWEIPEELRPGATAAPSWHASPRPGAVIWFDNFGSSCDLRTYIRRQLTEDIEDINVNTSQGSTIPSSRSTSSASPPPTSLPLSTSRHFSSAPIAPTPPSSPRRRARQSTTAVMSSSRPRKWYERRTTAEPRSVRRSKRKNYYTITIPAPSLASCFGIGSQTY